MSAPLGVTAAQRSALAPVQALLDAGQLDQAEARLRDTLVGDPRNLQARHLLAGLLGAAGRLDEALAVIEDSLRIEPRFAPALADKGNVLRLKADDVQAEHCYRQALHIEPKLLSARLNLASLLETTRSEEAAALYLDAANESWDPRAMRSAVTLLDRTGRSREARELCERALAHDPQCIEAHRGLGFLLLKREHAAAAALRHFEQVLIAEPNDAEVLANRGIALQDLGRLSEAISSYDAALTHNPEHHSARFHRGLAWLAQGRFEKGWPDYECRLLSEHQPVRQLSIPCWQGEDLSAKTLLICGEQGIGDEIMFASCIPEMLSRCDRIVIACAAKLAALFARSFPAAEILIQSATGELDELAAARNVDCYIPSGSLPCFLRRGINAFPMHHGYLKADKTKVAHYRARLDGLGAGLKVGLSWRGGTRLTRGPLRTLGLAQLQPIWATRGIQFVSLQYDGSVEELERLRDGERVAIQHWPDVLADYDDTAALVSALDLVISVCTAVIHLGGALGRPVWVMAPFSPEWRYGISGETMPWYPSVSVIRQSEPGDWSGVLQEVCLRLQRRLEV